MVPPSESKEACRQMSPVVRDPSGPSVFAVFSVIGQVYRNGAHNFCWFAALPASGPGALTRSYEPYTQDAPEAVLGPLRIRAGGR